MESQALVSQAGRSLVLRLIRTADLLLSRSQLTLGHAVAVLSSLKTVCCLISFLWADWTQRWLLYPRPHCSYQQHMNKHWNYSQSVVTVISKQKMPWHIQMITDPCNPMEDLDGPCRTSGVAGKLRLTCQKPEKMVFHGHHPSTGHWKFCHSGLPDSALDEDIKSLSSRESGTGTVTWKFPLCLRGL